MSPANHLFSWVNCTLYLGSTLIGPQMALFLPVPFYFRPNSSEYILVFCYLPTWFQHPFRKPLSNVTWVTRVIVRTPFICETVETPFAFQRELSVETGVDQWGHVYLDVDLVTVILVVPFVTHKHILHAFSRTPLKESAWVHTTATIKPQCLASGNLSSDWNFCSGELSCKFV